MHMLSVIGFSTCILMSCGIVHAGTITLLSLERSLRGGEVSVDPGHYARIRGFGSCYVCGLNPPRICCSSGGGGSARQTSFVYANAPDVWENSYELLAINATGSIYSGNRTSTDKDSTLVAEFELSENAFLTLSGKLSEDRGSATSARLVGESSGVVFDISPPPPVASDLSGQSVALNLTQRLPPDTYTFSVETEGVMSGAFSVDFALEAVPAGPGPTCRIGLPSSAYGVGEVVTINDIHVSNQTEDWVNAEYKVWVRFPDGRPILGVSAGASGELYLAPEHEENFGPVDLLGVTSETPIGLYEVGCRLLDPASGRELSRSRTFFEIVE